jgi:hypothetical protein
MPDGTKLGVYVGPPTNPQEQHGKLVGIIEISGGAGGMVLIDAKAPLIRKGTTVTVTNIGPIPFGHVVTLKGTF